jgi:hypothetical protein
MSITKVKGRWCGGGSGSGRRVLKAGLLKYCSLVSGPSCAYGHGRIGWVMSVSTYKMKDLHQTYHSCWPSVVPS